MVAGFTWLCFFSFLFWFSFCSCKCCAVFVSGVIGIGGAIVFIYSSYSLPFFQRLGYGMVGRKGKARERKLVDQIFGIY